MDEDENVRSRPVISEDDGEDMEDEAEPSKEPTLDKKSLKSETDSVNADDILEKRRMDAAEQIERKAKKNKERARRAKLAKFLEEEAELGSDNEEHDDVKKRIKSDDDEIEESDPDSDISDLVNDAPLGDQEEIAETNAAVRELHMKHVEEEDMRAAK